MSEMVSTKGDIRTDEVGRDRRPKKKEENTDGVGFGLRIQRQKMNLFCQVHYNPKYGLAITRFDTGCPVLSINHFLNTGRHKSPNKFVNSSPTS